MREREMRIEPNSRPLRSTGNNGQKRKTKACLRLTKAASNAPNVIQQTRSTA